jgi:glycosyltransferase involved in cell wall biosynthesis
MMSTDRSTMRPLLFSIVCVSPQAWDADLPTNRQQIMRRAARRGHNVLFVESGSFLWRGLSRILRKPWTELRRRLVGQTVDTGIQVRSARNVLPWGKRSRLASNVNFALTARMLRRATRELPRPVVLWLYDPCGASMVGSIGENLAVYDCVDDYAEQYARHSRGKQLVAEADREAGQKCRLVFATTEGLAARHRQTNAHTHLVPNAGDFDHFSPAAKRSLVASELRSLRPPVIGFAGNLTAGKVDFSLLRSVASQRHEWTLLLIGPVRAGAERELATLKEFPNVTWIGWKPYAELPQHVAAFDVGLCPYVGSAYTQNVFPLKVYEYLAAGKPVVATGTPSLTGMEPDVVLVDGAPSVLAAIEVALESSSDVDRARRMALAARNTWETRTERLLALISAELESAAGR